MDAKLRTDILRLLEQDQEFRYAVAGLLGLNEILRRLDTQHQELVKLREDLNRFMEFTAARFEAIDKRFEAMERRFEARFEAMDRRFEAMDKRFEAMDRRFEAVNKRFEAMDKRFEAVNRRFEAMDKRLDAMDRAAERRYQRLDKRLTGLGARWGIMSERAFRQGLRGILEREFGLKVERWRARDEAGMVYGFPSDVELDVAIYNGKILLIEISAHVRASDVQALLRKSELYTQLTGNKPARLVLVAPYADDLAKQACLKLGVELYTP